MDCFSGGSEPREWTASPVPATTAAIAIAARYLILMAMVPPSAPQINRTLSEMVPWRCLTLALERLLARRPDGILVNPVECGEIGPDLFRAAATRENRVGLCQHQRREVRERKLRSRL